MSFQCENDTYSAQVDFVAPECAGTQSEIFGRIITPHLEPFPFLEEASSKQAVITMTMQIKGPLNDEKEQRETPDRPRCVHSSYLNGDCVKRFVE